MVGNVTKCKCTRCLNVSLCKQTSSLSSPRFPFVETLHSYVKSKTYLSNSVIIFCGEKLSRWSGWKWGAKTQCRRVFAWIKMKMEDPFWSRETSQWHIACAEENGIYARHFVSALVFPYHHTGMLLLSGSR